MRVLICGGRDYNNWTEFEDEIHRYINFDKPGDITIIAGGADGADTLAKEFAKRYKMPYEEYRANWAIDGKRAGYIRNRRMLEEGKPDLVIAFPGGKGTAMMVRIAKEAGVKVIEV